MPHATAARIATSIALVGAVSLGGAAVGSGLATAAPGPVRTAPSLKNIKTVVTSVTWIGEEVLRGVVQYFTTQGLDRLTLANSPSAAQQAAAFYDHIPHVSPESVAGDATKLVQHSAASPSMDGVAHVSYVKGNPRELFQAITAGGMKINSTNEYRVDGMQRASYNPGTKTTKPSITVTNGLVTHKIIVLA